MVTSGPSDRDRSTLSQFARNGITEPDAALELGWATDGQFWPTINDAWIAGRHEFVIGPGDFYPTADVASRGFQTAAERGPILGLRFDTDPKEHQDAGPYINAMEFREKLMSRLMPYLWHDPGHAGDRDRKLSVRRTAQ